MKILILEPFYTGSHQRWVDGYMKYSNHDVRCLSLPGRHWKWRMHGGAISLARKFQSIDEKFDLILCSSLMDVGSFISLARKELGDTPVALYFHENQLTYPWSETDPDVLVGRDRHYAFINYTSALSADYVFFNSNYHRNSFIESLPEFLHAFPDQKGLENVDRIKEKSSVLYLGMDLQRFDSLKQAKTSGPPIILWNHRWEYDKNPQIFFESLFQLKEVNPDFKLVVVGESYSEQPSIFETAKSRLKDQIIHFGFVPDFESYAQLLWRSDIALTTSNQDFFGGSVVEALYCNCHALLPNRLSYKEHIKEEFFEDHFYDKDAEILPCLLKCMDNINEIRSTQRYQEFVVRYDWKNMAAIYDSTFASCGFSI